MEIKMSYYHILIEVNDHISTIEQTRDIELFDIIELKPYLHSICLLYTSPSPRDSLHDRGW
ncbi:hypothetical protein ACN6QN_16420, partial [Acinetobacter baumannii]